MNAKNAMATELNPLSKLIIGCAWTVANTLGCGFLEKVYENALAHELRKAGLAAEQQRGMTVTYDGVVVGEYFVDLLIEQAILIELKTVQALNSAHRVQCLNYLRATGMHLCLLMNFGLPRLEIRRIVLDL
ncbi:MAG TPA: GxxExxY protein [Acetobacteraceae bacterium]